MSNIFVTGKNTVYRMPLEGFDLGSWPLNGVAVKLDDHLKLLWSSNNFNHKEYFEFEIKAETSSKETASSFLDNKKLRFYKNNTNEGIEDMSQNLELQKCYICNVDVPKIYYIQHVSSNKHKVYSNIANSAMERIKKHINEISVFNTDTILGSTYFCDSCVMVVYNTDKTNHENSRSHLLCIKREKLIKDLSELYIDDEINLSFKTNEIKCEGNEIISSTEKLNKRIIPTKKLEITTEMKINKDQTSHSLSIYSKKDIDSHNMEKHINDTNHNTSLKIPMHFDETGNLKIDPKKNKQLEDKYNSYLKAYVEYITNKIPTLHSIQYANEKQIGIKAENGDMVKIPLENFHSITYNSPFSNDVTQFCKLCSQTIKTYNELEAHKYAEAHIKNIMSPIKDRDCIRKLAGIWSHCVLCNEQVATKDVNSHLSTQKHYQKKETAVMHLNTDKKVNDLRLENNANSKIECKGNQVTNLTNKNEKVTATETTLCKKEIINVNLKEYVKFIMDNVESKNSVFALDESYIKLKAINGDFIKVNIENFHGYLSSQSEYTHCYLCAETLLGTEIVKHKYTMEHIKKAMSPIFDRHCMRELDNGFHCILCNIRLNKACYHKHIRTQTHCDHLKTALMYMAETPVSEEKKQEIVKIYPCVMNNKKVTETYCDVCDLNIPTHHINSHIGSNKHKINEKNKTQDKSVILKINSTSIVKDNTKNKRVTRCDVCKEDIDTNNMNSHLNGNRHKLNLKLNSASVENVNTKNTGITHCDVCDIDIDTHNMNSHVNGNRHKLNLNATKSGNPNFVDHDSKKEAINYQMEHSVNSNHLTCMVCKVKIPNNTSNIDEHIRGLLHKKEYKLLMDKNKLSKVKNGHFCNVCKNLIKLTTELLHVNDVNHKLNLLKPPSTEPSVDMQATFCDLCKVEVGVNNMANHVSGKKHTDTYRQKANGEKNIPKPEESTVQPIIKTSDETSHCCEVCKVAVPNNPYNIITHYKGKQHASKLTLLHIHSM